MIYNFSKFEHKIQTAETPERRPFLKAVNTNKIQPEISFNAKIINLYKIFSLTDLRAKQQQQKSPLRFKRQNNETNVSFSKRSLLSSGMKNNNGNIPVWGVPGTILYPRPKYFSIHLYLQH